MADEADADLIMMSAHGTTGDAGERYGTVAARLLQESSRPIIVLQDLGGFPQEPTPAEEAVRARPGH
jgi:nucleotide-binding universal stress UspA family protein